MCRIATSGVHALALGLSTSSALIGSFGAVVVRRDGLAEGDSEKYAGRPVLGRPAHTTALYNIGSPCRPPPLRPATGTNAPAKSRCLARRVPRSCIAASSAPTFSTGKRCWLPATRASKSHPLRGCRSCMTLCCAPRSAPSSGQGATWGRAPALSAAAVSGLPVHGFVRFDDRAAFGRSSASRR